MSLSANKRMAATLLGMGKSKTSVAKHLGTSTSAIDLWMEKEDFAALVEEISAYHTEAMKDLLEDGERKAVVSLMELLEAEEVVYGKDGVEVGKKPNHEVRLKAAESLLNRMGRRGKPADKVEATTHNYSDTAVLSALMDPGVRQWLKQTGKDVTGLLPSGLQPEARVSAPREPEALADADYEVIPIQESDNAVAAG